AEARATAQRLADITAGLLRTAQSSPVHRFAARARASADGAGRRPGSDRRDELVPAGHVGETGAGEAFPHHLFTDPEPPKPAPDPPALPPPAADAPDPPASKPAAAGMGSSRGRRLCSCGGRLPAGQRGVVDVVVKLSTLMGLDDDPGLIPGWGPVLADVARQVAFDQQTNPAWRYSVTDEGGHLLHHGHIRRRPTAAERAFVKARDRSCRAPGCRRAAVRCDDDHRVDHAKGGPSHRGNCVEFCRRHHRLKHAKGFTIHQIGPDSFFWEARDGRLYFVPADGNIMLIGDEPDPDGVWDLADMPPPRPVRQIIPTGA
ncbi:MAG: HNH endonuclease signature motif containing protein, partial [Gemmatimonadales bacterium]